MFEVILILAVGVAFLIETHLARHWSSDYSVTGIRILRRSCHALNPASDLPRSERMELRFLETDLPTFDFKWIGAERLAFHENYSGAKTAYTQVMRGYLSFNRRTGEVEVVGLLNYFALFFALALAAGALVSRDLGGLLFLPFGLLILGICYTMQAGRYDEVLSAAAAEWGSQDALTTDTRIREARNT